MLFSWCCCRDGRVPGNETKVELTGRSPIGITDKDLREEEIGGAELHTPRDSEAQKAINRSNGLQTVRDPRIPRVVEKEKLKALVREFAKAASVSGLAVNLANPLTGKIIQSKFELDKYLMWFTLTPPPTETRKTESGTQPDKVQYMLISVTAVARGREILERVPNYPKDLAETTVLLDAEKPEDRTFFIINDDSDRKRFYMSIKIIRMSVDVSRKQRSDAKA